ncbi:hypothetical protein OB919_11840 [Halobacteria archaeon AArc-curdl1]|uniref:Uncharacterized protein n=1 Tax=Natronosalvus hydrolyticus TaxID=2979988 RepID=A0AAP2ZAW8_9EURY|nr:hypothetical protein [Halobacteria archaeon AArc-curdl1]
MEVVLSVSKYEFVSFEQVKVTHNATRNGISYELHDLQSSCAGIIFDVVEDLAVNGSVKLPFQFLIPRALLVEFSLQIKCLVMEVSERLLCEIFDIDLLTTRLNHPNEELADTQIQFLSVFAPRFIEGLWRIRDRTRARPQTNYSRH